MIIFQRVWEGSKVRNLETGEEREVAYTSRSQEVEDQFNVLYKEGVEKGDLMEAHTFLSKASKAIDVHLCGGGRWAEGSYEVLSGIRTFRIPETPEEALQEMRRSMGESVNLADFPGDRLEI